jgi:DnaJ-class molecular chaperone
MEEDPYVVFGLVYPCTKEVIKARYYELARKHHPDKLQHLSKEEIDANEHKLKLINRAYETLTKTDYEPEWNFNSIFETVINNVKNYTAKLLKEHHITVEVTLEELFNKKEKRLRLFLKGITQPIFITIHCSDKLHIHNELDIHITYKILPHKIYSVEEDGNDIYSTIYISLYEFVKGCGYKIEYLDKTIVNITIPECDTSTIVIPKKGLYGDGSLVIFIKIDLPKKEDINPSIRNKLLKYLKNMSNAPQNGLF